MDTSQKGVDLFFELVCNTNSMPLRHIVNVTTPLTSLDPNSSSPHPPKFSKLLTINPKTLLDVAKNPTISTHRWIGILFQPFPTLNNITMD
jgi:hypothetical protein